MIKYKKFFELSIYPSMNATDMIIYNVDSQSFHVARDRDIGTVASHHWIEVCKDALSLETIRKLENRASQQPGIMLPNVGWEAIKTVTEEDLQQVLNELRTTEEYRVYR